MALTINQMRNMIAGVYNSNTWRARVANMSDSQVYAVYNNFLANDKFAKAVKKGIAPRKKVPDGHTTQLSFFDEIDRKGVK